LLSKLKHFYSKAPNDSTYKLKGDGNLLKNLSLTRLNISGFSIESGALKHLSETLQVLSLSGYSVETIKPDALRSLTNLRKIIVNEKEFIGEKLIIFLNNPLF
jgi:hypothetical protein